MNFLGILLATVASPDVYCPEFWSLELLDTCCIQRPAIQRNRKSMHSELAGQRSGPLAFAATPESSGSGSRFPQPPTVPQPSFSLMLGLVKRNRHSSVRHELSGHRSGAPALPALHLLRHVKLVVNRQPGYRRDNS